MSSDDEFDRAESAMDLSREKAMFISKSTGGQISGEAVHNLLHDIGPDYVLGRVVKKARLAKPKLAPRGEPDPTYGTKAGIDDGNADLYKRAPWKNQHGNVSTGTVWDEHLAPHDDNAKREIGLYNILPRIQQCWEESTGETFAPKFEDHPNSEYEKGTGPKNDGRAHRWGHKKVDESPSKESANPAAYFLLGVFQAMHPAFDGTTADNIWQTARKEKQLEGLPEEELERKKEKKRESQRRRQKVFRERKKNGE